MRAQISRIMLVLALAATFAASLPVAPALAEDTEVGASDQGPSEVRDIPDL